MPYVGAIRSAAAAGLLLLAACGGSPSQPNPVPAPPPPPPANKLPVIDSIAAQGRRPKEPAAYADLGEAIDVKAEVHDEETGTDGLQFEWTASAGTFEGTGPAVTWHAPDTAETPIVATMTLKVIEKYGYPDGPKIYQQDVSSSIDVSLHDSIKEVSEMARQFLLDFSDSDIRDVPYIMRNFQPGCYGTDDETAQVTNNRRQFRIVDSRVGDAATTVNFGGVCAYNGRPGDACTRVPVSWTAIDHDDHDRVGTAAGADWLASVYVAAERRWRLCDSSFQPNRTSTLRFFAR